MSGRWAGEGALAWHSALVPWCLGMGVGDAAAGAASVAAAGVSAELQRSSRSHCSQRPSCMENSAVSADTCQPPAACLQPHVQTVQLCVCCCLSHRVRVVLLKQCQRRWLRHTEWQQSGVARPVHLAGMGWRHSWHCAVLLSSDTCHTRLELICCCSTLFATKSRPEFAGLHTCFGR